MLDSGEDPNQTNNAGETALILAVQRGFEKAVSRLLQAGADALKAGGDITTGAHTSALYFSLKDGNHNIIKMLLDSIRFSAYEKICWYRSLAGANGYTSFSDESLLKVENISCQPTPIESLPPLFQAICKDDIKSFQKLLAKGVDPHETVLPNMSNGLSALHTAIRLHRGAMFDQLIEHGVDINQRNSPYHYSPLFVAVHSKNKHAYRKLLDLGALDLPTENHHTALFAAVYTNDMTAVQELVARGSDLKQYAQWGYCTLVYAAARYGHIDVLKYLLSLGLHPDWDAEGKTYYYEQFYGLRRRRLPLQ